jgi:trans-aconitate methyltransferase
MTAKITPANAEFDFVRYFTRVQKTPFWHEMQVGLATFAGAQPGMSVLDLGCGPGRLVDHLQANGVQAIGTAAAHSNQTNWDDFAQKHLVNWAGVAENNRRWSAADLQQLFAAANLTHFTTQTTLGRLARYAKGRKSN